MANGEEIPEIDYDELVRQALDADDAAQQNNRLSMRDVGGMMLGAANTATFEMAPKIGAGLLAIPSAFTEKGYNKGFHEIYDPAMANYKAFQEERPGLDIGSRVVGGLTPMGLEGLVAKGLGRTAAGALRLNPATRLAEAITKGAAPTVSSQVIRGAGAGAADAALRSLATSENDPGIGTTIANALYQGAIGGGMGGLVGGAIQGGGNLINTLRQSRQNVPSEVGLITRRTIDVPEEELRAGQARLRDAERMDQPMTMFDAVEARQPTELAYQMGAKPENFRATKDFLRERQLTAPDRAARGLESIHPGETDLATSGQRLQAASQGKLESDVARQTGRVEQGYRTIERGRHEIADEGIAAQLAEPDSLLNDYVGMVRRGSSKDRLRNRPDNSFEVLNEVKKTMDGDIRNARELALVDRTKATNVRDLTRAKNQVLDAMTAAVPGYQTVLNRYARHMPEITRVQRGPIGQIAGVEPTSFRNIPAQLTKLTPAELQQMRVDLGPNGLEVLKENFRAHLEDLAHSDDTGNKVVGFLTKGTKAYRKLETLLGTDDLGELFQFFDNERRMAYTAKEIAGGSPTAPRIEGMKSLEEEDIPALGFAKNLQKKGPLGYAAEFVGNAIAGNASEKQKALYGRTARELYQTGPGARNLIEAIIRERAGTLPVQQGVRRSTAQAIPAVDSILIDAIMNKRRGDR